MEIASFLDIGQFAFLAVVASVGVAVMMRYLQKERANGSSSDKQIEEIRREIQKLRNSAAHKPEDLEKYVSEIKYQLDEVRARQAGISADQQQELVKKISENITSEAAESVLEKIKKEAAEDERTRTKFTLVEEQFQPTINRLKDELFSLSKRGNLNLSIGIMITVVGLGLLGMFVLSFSNSQKDMATFFMDFFPRISLVLLIEIFAYFFLSLYKSSLSEIKYFQNEITSMESKYLALKVALESSEKETINYVVEQLAKSERNFILEKGQSTVDLERAKNDQAATSDILGKVASIFGNKP
jgi:hypothetical protein